MSDDDENQRETIEERSDRLIADLGRAMRSWGWGGRDERYGREDRDDDRQR